MSVLRNDLDDGELSRAGDSFASNVTERLAELSALLLSPEGYRPAPLRGVDIGKSTPGETRHLSIPSVRDRVVERAIVNVLTDLIDHEFSPWSFGYRRGLGVTDALRALIDRRQAGMGWVARADVNDCFDSLDHDQLLRELRDRVDDDALLRLVQALLERPTFGRPGAGRVNERGAPQGGPLSPLLCNLYLHRLDMRMLNNGWVSIRYADDIALPTVSQSAAKDALEQMRRICDDLGIELGDDKTEICSFDEGFVFLGEDINARYPDDADVTPLRTPDRKALYVGRDGAVVRTSKGRLIVSKDDDDLLAVPISHVGSISLFGSVGLSAAVRQYSLANDVHVTFLSRRGSLLGTLRGAGGSDPAVVRAQVATTADDAFALSMARSFVQGKLGNMRTLLLRLAPDGDAVRITRAAEQILDRWRDVESANDVPTVMGLEGSGSASYFSALADVLPEWTNFTTRQRNPPPDPVNALLSYGYTIITSETVGALASARLDPSFGYLHSDARDRPSLALDLVEEFRPLIVDQVVINLVRRGTLTATSFRSDERNGAVLLTEKGRRNFTEALETRMLETFTHLPTGRKVSYRRALHLQARQVARAVRTGRADYEPIRWRV